MGCGCPSVPTPCACAPACDSATTMATTVSSEAPVAPVLAPVMPSPEPSFPVALPPLPGTAVEPTPLQLPVPKVSTEPIATVSPVIMNKESHMLVVFANNQCMVDYNLAGATVTTDPVAIGDANQATGITTVHKAINASAFAWIMQVSNDGVNWVPQGPSSSSAAESTTMQTPTKVSGVYARLSITFTATTSNIGAIMFDVHVNFDRA